MSIGSINTINPFLQAQFSANPAAPGAAAAAINNPFATNVLGQQANAFGSGFGAKQGSNAAPIDPAMLALLSGGKKEAPKEDGMKEILTLIMSLIGKDEGSTKTKQAAPANAASDCADGSCGSAGCEDANNDGVCDAGGEECVDNDGDGECDTCPEGNCG